MCSMGRGGAAGRKVMGVFMVAMLPSFVEAGMLVTNACKTFGSGAFDKGCFFGCGTDDYYYYCEEKSQTPRNCYNEC